MAAPPSGPAARSAGSRLARLGAWAILAGGTALALVALVWRADVQDRDDRVFAEKVANVQAVVSTELARQADLLASLRGLVVANPGMSNDQFASWFEAAAIPERFPGTIGVSYLQRVPAADLPAFAARQTEDPVTGLDTEGPFTVFPATDSDVYCLERLGVFQTSEVLGFTIPAGLDFCASELPGIGPLDVEPVLDAATASAKPAVVPPDDLTDGVLGEFAPVYTTPTPPATAEGRRQQVVGWVGGSFSSDQLVEAAVAAAPDTAVRVSHAIAGTPVTVAEAGNAPDGTHTATVAVSDDATWTLQVAAPRGDGGLSAASIGWIVFATGVTISGLVFLLVRVLAGSRQRALDLVAAKTEQLEHQALHDTLTGLPNRALLLDRASRMLVRRQRAGDDGDPSTVAALFVDLDDFKTVNDSLGHAAGDQYLRAIASRIQTTLRGSDTIGRLGGDEFVVLVETALAGDGPEMVADRIMDVLSEPIRIGETEVPVSCSIGIAAGAYDSAEALLHDADLAMYEAKVAGKGRVVVFEPAMEEAMRDRVNLEWELRGALERDELFVLYQPTFDLRTGVTTGVEALLRWQHPTRGVVGPLEFVPLAEETGLIVPIGAWVLDTACAEAAAWRDRGHPVPVAVNVSGRQLERDDFVDTVRRALSATGLPPALLVLEITETTIMRDAPETRRRLQALKGLGVGLAIDDFGTGYSSMAHLQRFPVDAIKIDRAFIAGIADSPESHALIRTLIQLGKALRLETLAEGIEDRGQLDQLIRDDCDSGQGFLYARPFTADALERFLAQQSPAPEAERGARA